MTCAPSGRSWLSASGGRGGVGYSTPERLTKTVDAIFACLAKLIGTTARVGAYVMVATAVLVALVESHVQPFARLAEPPLYLYQGIVTAGVLGFAILVVEIVVASWQRFRQWRAGRIIFNHGLPGITSRTGTSFNCEPSSWRRTTVIATSSRPAPGFAFASSSESANGRPAFKSILTVSSGRRHVRPSACRCRFARIP
jgi:hypothetical protein